MVTTRTYGCGGHVTKGNKVCQMNPILQAELESLVIGAVLNFHKPYLGKGGGCRVAEAVKQQTGSESKEVAAARKRAESELQKLTRTINNLLDNITAANREFVDERLKELADQRQRLESRIDEFDRLATSQAEIKSIATETARFLSGLEFTLRIVFPQEKLAALRQCIDRVQVDKPVDEAVIAIRVIPAGNLDATQDIRITLAASRKKGKPDKSAKAGSARISTSRSNMCSSDWPRWRYRVTCPQESWSGSGGSACRRRWFDPDDYRDRTRDLTIRGRQRTRTAQKASESFFRRP